MRWLHGGGLDSTQQARTRREARPRVAVMDDWQSVARASADWSALEARADVVFLGRPFADEDDAASTLAGFDVILPMRERTPITGTLISRLPHLRLVAQTGSRAMTMDLPALNAAGVLVCGTGGERSARGTAELALGLLLAAARRIPQGDAAIRDGRFQDGVGVGPVLHGTTLGIVGLGRIGALLAGYAAAIGMHIVAWSPNLTAERAAAGGATLVSRDELLSRSDAISLHIVLSPATRGLLGAPELARMKPGAILVNTSRGPLVDEAALLAALGEGRIRAGLDVFDAEPLPQDAPIRTAPNCVLTPHLGYGTTDTFRQFYGESVANILAFLDGAPTRVLNPEAAIVPPAAQD